MTDTRTTSSRALMQRQLARHLVGEGLELGPGHSPYPLPYAGCTIRYVDRWEPQENRTLFPELGDEGRHFREPDIICNLDVDRLSAVDDQSQDFVIASHVLEHLAEPLGLLRDIERVLRPGGNLLILLPDRRRTFDREREPTSFQHLLLEHRAGVQVVDDEHARDFLVGTGELVDHLDPARRSRLFDLHRKRSIHVHVWDEREWADTLANCISELGQRWLLVDVLNNGDVPDSIEFGMVLRKDYTSLSLDQLRQRFEQIYAQLGPEREIAAPEVAGPVEIVPDPCPVVTGIDPEDYERVLRDLELARDDARNWSRVAQKRGARLAVLDASLLGPALRVARQLRQRSSRRRP